MSILLEKPASVIKGGAYFLRPNEKFKVGKPYAFKFPVPDDAVQQTNMEFEKVVISATNMRGFEKSFTLESNGFTVISFNSGLQYEDFHDEKSIRPYFEQLESWLKDHLGARHVEIFRHGVNLLNQTIESEELQYLIFDLQIRKRHAAYPVSTGEIYEFDQPTTIAHIGLCV